MRSEPSHGCYLDGHSPETDELRTLTQTSVGLDPSGWAAALLLAELAPVADLDVVVRLHDVVDVLVRIDLKRRP